MSFLLLNVVHNVPPSWLTIPFIGLLLCIATGPLFFEKFWHKHYKLIGIVIGVGMALYYTLVLKQGFIVAETFAEYVSFICIMFSLYVAAGGVFIFVDVESKTWVNIAFLLLGALLTNLIGTTGASVLLIRPFMRVNRYRLKPYHVVFFIFFVSNLGGLLTPIGDPPLFMGFLKGVPFFWTTAHLWPYWMVALSMLVVVFYFFEKRNTSLDDVDVSAHYTQKIIIQGKQNFIWLTLIIVTVFLDPNVIDGFPAIEIHGKKVSFIRETLMLLIGLLAYKTANKNALKSNHFNFEPVKEVAFLFFGIFLAMIPALQLLEHAGNSGLKLSVNGLYWITGALSSVLDNAPTYVNFLALTLSMSNLSVGNVNEVREFVAHIGGIQLEAISVGAVFFGALTYIGNGPNFMVKAIAEQQGVKMPTFFGYVFKYALPILLPILGIVWLLFLA